MVHPLKKTDRNRGGAGVTTKKNFEVLREVKQEGFEYVSQYHGVTSQSTTKSGEDKGGKDAMV